MVSVVSRSLPSLFDEVNIDHSSSPTSLTRLFPSFESEGYSFNSFLSLSLIREQELSVDMQPFCCNLMQSGNDDSLVNVINQSSYCLMDRSDVNVRTCGKVFEVPNGEFSGFKYVKGAIVSNFYVDAINCGVPASVVDKAFKVLGSQINFKRSLHSGDKFEIIYSPDGRLSYAKVVSKNKSACVYGMVSGKKHIFYCSDLKSINVSSGYNGYFCNPMRGRLTVTSPFGWRIHPIYGGRRYHAGIDYKACYGTPVFAVCDAIVSDACYYGGYGKMILLSHNDGYKTRYAHLSNFSRNVRRGAKVSKGQIIGYTGNSGSSTGPHLHFEVTKNGRLIDPKNLKIASAVKVERMAVSAFLSNKRKIDNVIKLFD